MEIVEIEEKAEYIKELFEKEKYDSFYLYEARVKTKLDYYVNGRLNREYFDTEAQADLPEYIEWKDIKATVYAYLKGEDHFDVQSREYQPFVGNEQSAGQRGGRERVVYERGL